MGLLACVHDCPQHLRRAGLNVSPARGEGEIMIQFVIQEKLAYCLACMLAHQVGVDVTPDLHVHEFL